MGLRERYRAAPRNAEAGYAMAGMLVAITIMGIVMSMIVPTWRTWAKREKEAELIFRGEQYMRAIELYQRRFAGAYPTDVDALVDQRFLRKAYLDPMTGDEFDILTQASLRAEPIQAPPGAGTPGVTQPQQFGSVTQVDQDRGTGSSPTPFSEAARGIGEGSGGHHRRRQQLHRDLDGALQPAGSLRRVAVRLPATVGAAGCRYRCARSGRRRATWARWCGRRFR